MAIREVVPRENWRHVSGEENPADLPTRRVNDFNESLGEVWFQGPRFLCNSSLDCTVPNFTVNDKLKLLKLKNLFTVFLLIFASQ